MDQAFLDVDKSFSGRLWKVRPYDERQALALAQRHTLPDVIAKSLSARGILLDDAENFLEPRLRDLLPDPNLLKDMTKAVARTVEAIRHRQKLVVYGDYDVDGATSAALLLRFGRGLGQNWGLYVPDRFREGYGPNVAAMKKLANEEVKLVLCVDCGTTAHEPLKTAAAVGLDVIVLDHHAPEAALPAAYAVINPNRIDEDHRYGNLAAVGVTFLFLIALNRALRSLKYYSAECPEPDLLSLLDLVALGTVCDVVRLSELNRAFVSQGLKVMSQKLNPGIVALSNVAGLKSTMDTYAAGFVLGPRINAGGRVGQSDFGAKLLSTADPVEALSLAQQLHQLNDQRRQIEASVLAEAEQLVPKNDQPLIFVASSRWHAGVIGIVASRLKDKFNRPALVVALEGGIGKGSGRSVAGLDLGSHIIAARQAGLLINGGGHTMAAGFTVAESSLEALREFLMKRIGQILSSTPIKPTLMVDGLISAAALEPSFVKQLMRLGPFGTGNSEPRFALADCQILRADIVGEKHVSLILLQNGIRFRAIAFRAMDNDLGEELIAAVRKKVHLAGHLRLDEWQGEERVQLHLSDAALPNPNYTLT